MDTQRIRELLDQRDAIDEQLKAAIGGEVKERKPQVCGTCQEPGHSSRTCPRKPRETLSLPRQ